MNTAILTGLTALASRSRRFRPHLPWLSVLPAVLGAYQLYRRKTAGAARMPRFVPPSGAVRAR